MSLYAHFSNKEELLDLLYCEVSLRIYADSGLAGWKAQMEALCHQIRKVLLAHPNWVPLLSRPALPTMSLPVRERLLILMVEAGVPAEQALNGFTSALVLSLGLTLVELGYNPGPSGRHLAARFERLRDWASDSPFGTEHPVTRQAFEKLGRLDLSTTFSMTVSAFIEGLEAQLTRR
jgi:hypothetical protein